MTKAYWVATYRSVGNPEALAAYARSSAPVLSSAGARPLARGLPAHVFESGLMQRTVVLEFDSAEQARAAYESQAYQEALKLLGDGAVRDIRIVEAFAP